MLWIRGVMFTLLVPGTVAAAIPRWISAERDGWFVGWVLVAAGSAFYALSLLRFLAAGGPSIYFSRPLRVVALYGLLLAPVFHFVVTVFEEPHLRKERGAAYEEYCRRVPRWFII